MSFQAIKSRQRKEWVGVWISVLRSILQSTTNMLSSFTGFISQTEYFHFFSFSTCLITTISSLLDFASGLRNFTTKYTLQSLKILMNDRLELNSHLSSCMITTAILKRHLKFLSPAVIWEWIKIAVFLKKYEKQDKWN